MGECIFCKIISGQVPCSKQYEDDNVFAFDDISPKAPVHILVLPKKHIVNIASAEPDDAQIIGECNLVAAKIAKEKGLKGFRILNACGKEGGQTVFHIHYHLIGGWVGESPEMEIKPMK